MSVTCPDIDSLRTWRCKVWTTFLAVNAPQPKCHWTPLLRLKVHVLPSGLMCQSVASIGTNWCQGSSSTRASYTGAYWEAKTRVMRRGSFCSRSNCTATFRRSTWDGVGERIGTGEDVWADVKPCSTSSTTMPAMPYRSKSFRPMTTPPIRGAVVPEDLALVHSPLVFSAHVAVYPDASWACLATTLLPGYG